MKLMKLTVRSTLALGEGGGDGRAAVTLDGLYTAVAKGYKRAKGQKRQALPPAAS